MQAMFAVLSRPSSVPDGTEPVAAGGAAVPGVSLELRDVRFGYGDGREARLAQSSFTLHLKFT